MIEDELQLRSADQTPLWVRRARPEAGVKARLAIVHGFAEHGGRYQQTIRWFAERGVACSVLDLRGHGRSGGRRTYVTRWDEYLDDVEALLRHVEAEARGDASPLLLLGHSMGGLIVARTLQARRARLPKLAGAAMLSPLLDVKMKLPGWKVGAATALSRWAPWFRLPADLDVSTLSRDPAIGEAYLADPLVSHGATARWFTESVQARALAMEQAASLDLPLLVMHGEDDGLVCPDATRRFTQRLGPGERTVRFWPGGRHELLNESNKDEVRAAILSWLEARLAAPAAPPAPATA